MGFESFYHANYRKLLVFSLSLLLLSVVFLGYKYFSTGSFADKAVVLKGGLTLRVDVSENKDIGLLTDFFRSKNIDVSVRALEGSGRQIAVVFETADMSENEFLSLVREAGVVVLPNRYTVEFLGSSLGRNFYRQIVLAALIAFVAMSVVVFITFRNPVPSGFVVLAAASDIISTLAVLSLFHFKISTASIAAFLMLIGYSVDTDILLTTRVLKHKEGSLRERINSAARTGITMSLTSLIAMLVGYSFSSNETISQIMLVLSIGLVFDMIYTWFQNATILRVYLERRGVL
ncbi:protein translocase subunit SecF [Candidatus Woesearchaeota archaeon]|nr:protein translocase subunit SecF [Candidatus Woesearchaeota archaeon]